MIMAAAAVAMTLCLPGPRDNCVVDDDTFWQAGEKIRIADIDAPELNAQCVREKVKADRAKDRLLELLNEADYRIKRTGTGRYGRTLAIVTNARGSIGDELVREGLARTWSGRRESWC